jgi:hypothetical protein
MPNSISHIQSVIPTERFLKPSRNTQTTAWWGPVWRGLFVDPTGKHYRTIGRALWLYGYLIVHADRRTGTLYRKVATIASDMQVPTRTIQAWLTLLRQRGYIQTKQTGRALVIGIKKWRPVIKKER